MAEDTTKQAEAKAAAVSDVPTDSEIKTMKRGELNQLAVVYGLDPDQYKRADELRSAIFAARQAAAKQAEAEASSQAKAAVAQPPSDQPAQPEPKKGPKPRIRPLVERRGKKYRQATEQIDKGKYYSLTEAIALAQKTAKTAFDSTVELHVRLNVDPKKADQNIRTSLVLPHGTGKTVRVAVFAEDDDAAAAKQAGADLTDRQTIQEELEKEQLNFDVLIATPDTMGQLGKYARLLGPKGLMPNPKSGTVTKEVTKAVNEAKAGRIELRVDRYGILHTPVGKVSFAASQLVANCQAVLKAVNETRPASVKGEYVRSVNLTTTMGPGIKLERTLTAVG